MYPVSTAGQATRSFARLRSVLSSASIPASTTSSSAKHHRVNPAPLPQLFFGSDGEKEEQNKGAAIFQSAEGSEPSMDVNELNEDIFCLNSIPSRSIYNRIKRPATFICPFSASSRANRCMSFENPRKRKVQISNHLRIVQQKED